MFLGIKGTSIQPPRVKRLFHFKFDAHTLTNAAGQGWLPVDNSVFTEKYALPGALALTMFAGDLSQPLGLVLIPSLG